MIGVDRNVDFRYAAGFPDIDQALRDGTKLVRCISLPEMEDQASVFQSFGIRVWAVYTGESDRADRYIMRNCSMLQIGNEPGYAYPGGGASWPTGSADDMVNVWNHIATVVAPSVHPQGLPLIGPGIWAQDFARWAQVAARLPGLSAAAVHVYPDQSGPMSLSALRANLKSYRAVRSDLPLLAGEWMSRQPRVLQVARAIDEFCDARLWYGPDPSQPWLHLDGTPEHGLLALTRS